MALTGSPGPGLEERGCVSSGARLATPRNAVIDVFASENTVYRRG